MTRKGYKLHFRKGYSLKTPKGCGLTGWVGT